MYIVFMDSFHSTDFFDVTAFAHSKLFLKDQFAWEGLKALKTYFSSLTLGKIECTIPEGVTLVNPHLISIGKGTVIQPNTYIEGPCFIGKGCEVRFGAYLRSFVLTGDQCVLGHSSEVKHSILFNKAKVPHFNYVGDSILGNAVNLGAGVVCANFRLDHKEVIIRAKEHMIKSGLKKMGAIIGDGSQIGCNSVINPGILLKKKSLFSPCSSINKSSV